MRSIILYILGVPVTIIVLIALFTHHFWKRERGEPYGL
jgi:uncharacterized protein involved in outer membrane biogenesis